MGVVWLWVLLEVGVLCCGCVGFGSGARLWAPEEIPNPAKNPEACGRPGVEKSWLCDPDGILSVTEADTLEGLQQLIFKGLVPYNKMMCHDTLVGVEVAVVVVRRLEIQGSDAAKRTAKALHDRWGVGDAVCNLGVVVVLALDDRQLYISTGRGVRQVLPDRVVQTIARNMRAPLRENKVADALQMCVDSIGRAVSGKHVKDNASFAGEDGGNFGWVFVVGFFGVVGYLIRRDARKRTQYRRCAEQLSRLDADRAQVRANTYQQKSCPICLEDFPPQTASSSSSGVSENSSASSEMPKPGSSATKGSSASPTEATTATASGAPRPTRLLRCGHKFCQECIRDWLDTSNNLDCPVCREPLSGESTARSNGGAESSSSSLPAQGGYVRNEFGAEREMRFRLGRLRHMYPEYITPGMYNRWRCGNYTDTYGSDVEFRRLDPTTARRAASVGSSGASSSFGGGSSRGGGGGGSSW